MKINLVYIIIFLISVFISSVSQTFLKKSANKVYDSKVKEYLNPIVIGSYIVFFIATFLTIFAYKEVPLSLGPILEASGYIYISILGVAFLKEKMSLRKILGMIIIMVGIFVFYI